MANRLKASLAVVALAVIALAIFIESTQTEVTHHSIAPADARLRPIRVLQISDLHLQYIGRRELAVIAQVNALKPDLLVFSGDVIDDATKMPVLEHFLSLLETDHKVAVLGNWEHWSGINLAALRTLYARHAVRLLVNEQARYPVGGRTLVVMGLDDFTGGQPDSSAIKVTGQSGEVSLLVQHSPGWFQTADAQALSSRVSLCLAGHTHGGQIAAFGIALWTPNGSGRFVAGLYDLTLCPLYVSRGVGTSIAPVRIGARPEIALFTL